MRNFHPFPHMCSLWINLPVFIFSFLSSLQNCVMDESERWAFWLIAKLTTFLPFHFKPMITLIELPHQLIWKATHHQLMLQNSTSQVNRLDSSSALGMRILKAVGKYSQRKQALMVLHDNWFFQEMWYTGYFLFHCKTIKRWKILQFSISLTVRFHIH